MTYKVRVIYVRIKSHIGKIIKKSIKKEDLKEK